MKRLALLLSALEIAITLWVVWAAPDARVVASVASIVGLTAAFALVGLVPIHLELRRHACTIVLTDAVLVVGLFMAHSFAVVVAAALGEAVACLTARQHPLKLTYNVAAAAGATSLAVGVFSLRPVTGAEHPSAWVVTALAVACFAGWNLIATATILATAEGRPVRSVLGSSAQAAAVASAASASLGLALVVLAAANPVAPVLLVPLIGAVVVSTRRVGLQSAEHLRFQRLYEASSRSGRLAGFSESLAAVADEARGLLTGSSAICCAIDPEGAWSGVLVDDAGSRPADHAAVSALVALAADGARVISLTELDRAALATLPAAVDLVLAPAARGSRVPVVLAVFREIGPDDQGTGRVEVLSAFAGHAALTVANALLYEEVDVALRHQLDLNRQKGEFVAAVSHELRTPLTSIIGSVATIRRLHGRLDDAAITRLLEGALGQGERLRHLIDELLLVAAADHGEMVAGAVPTELVPLVEGVVVELQRRSGGRLSVAADDPCVVVTDDEKLRRIVVNLVDNAIKYAPEGPIEVAVHASSSEATLTVTDHGPGIAASDRERCFERFVQLDQSSTRRHGGVGLGLHLSRQLAELLGATLTLHETAGGGCTFVLSLPVHAPADDQVGGPVIALTQGATQ
jgi:signal transduction histidine kinase